MKMAGWSVKNIETLLKVDYDVTTDKDFYLVIITIISIMSRM